MKDMKTTSPIQSRMEMGSDQLNKKVGGRRISRKQQGLVVAPPDDDLSEDSTLLETVVVEKRRMTRISKAQPMPTSNEQQTQPTSNDENAGKGSTTPTGPQGGTRQNKLPRRRDAVQVPSLDDAETNGSKPRRCSREGRRKTRPDEDSGMISSRRSRSVDAFKTAFGEDRFSAGNHGSSAAPSVPVRPMRQESERGRNRRSTSVDAARYREVSNNSIAKEGLTSKSAHQPRSNSPRLTSVGERRRMDIEASRRSRSASRDRSKRRDMMGSNHEPRRRKKTQSMPSPQPGASKSVAPPAGQNQSKSLSDVVRCPLQGKQVDDAISIQTPLGGGRARSRSGERTRRRMSGDTSLHTPGTTSSSETTGVRRMPKGSAQASSMVSVSVSTSPSPSVTALRRRSNSAERPRSLRRINGSGVETMRSPQLSSNRRTAKLLEHQNTPKSQRDVKSTSTMSAEMRKIVSDLHLNTNNHQCPAVESPALRRRKERRAVVTGCDTPSVSSAPIGGVNNRSLSWKALVEAKTKGHDISKNKQSSSKPQSLRNLAVHGGGEAEFGGSDWGWPEFLSATKEEDDRNADRLRPSSRKLKSTSNMFQSTSCHSPKPRRSTSAVKSDKAAWDSDSDS